MKGGIVILVPNFQSFKRAETSKVQQSAYTLHMVVMCKYDCS